MPNFRKLLKEVIDTHKDDPKWESGDFCGIKRISNTKVGSVGQAFIESICQELGVEFFYPINQRQDRSTQSPWDIKIQGVTFEIKTATEDTNGKFQFNHIRYHRSYDALLCLGIGPDAVFFNIWSKAEVATGKAGKLVSMEKSGNASYKLTKAPNELIIIDDFRIVLELFLSSGRI